MRVQLSAVAKNEAAYLPEWIYHHLNVGFDDICVYVNRTTDNSVNILKKIGSKYPAVRFKEIDFFDLARVANIQLVGYALALGEAREAGFDYQMFLDIDEYWYSKDPDQTIHSHIEQLNKPDVVLYEWFNRSGESTPFSLPLAKVVEGFRNKHVKAVFNLSLEIEYIAIHNVFSQSDNYVLANGDRYILDTPHGGFLPTTSNLLKDEFILHRINRSEMEYVALLARGHASKPGAVLKSNRFGFDRDKHEYRDELSVNEMRLQDYQDGFSSFIRETDIEEDLKTAQKLVRERYDDFVQAIPNLPKEYADQLKVAFINISLPDVLEAYNQFTKKISNDPIALH